MILSLLERLEQEGGGSGWRPGGLAADVRKRRQPSEDASHLPSRWFASVGSLGDLSSVGAPGNTTSSGRLASASSLVAERTDDGVLVAAPVEGSGERIVWVGDLELGGPHGASRDFLTPEFDFHADGMGLDVAWETVGRSRSVGGDLDGDDAVVTMRLTLPCRPVGELTFSNEDLDTEVWLCSTRDGRKAARMRPYSALPELEIVPGTGSLEFEPSPDWRLGLEVMDPDGSLRVEDRFSPGTFVLRIPAGETTVRLSIRIVAPSAAERGRRGGALGALLGSVRTRQLESTGASLSTVPGPQPEPDELRMTAMTLPGAQVQRDVCSLDQESELRELLLAAAPHVQGPRFDVALWAARAAFLIQPRATQDVTSVTLPFLRGVVGRIEAELAATGCPGGAAAGLPRWCRVPSLAMGAGKPGVDGAVRHGGSTDGNGAEIPVEYAALLHQCCQHAAELAAAAGDARFARKARRMARVLRRWFQAAYWMSRPERAADLAFLEGPTGVPKGTAPDSPQPSDGNRWDRVRALCLRPHMLLAASFEGAPFTTAQRRLIVRVIEARLLVPGLGISTLDCDDVEFHGHSLGNGAVWPFLLGPFVEASLRAFGSDRGRQRLLLGLLMGRLNSQGLETQPMAWAHSAGALTSPKPYRNLEPVHSGRHPMPLGPLSFALNSAEEARAKKLLTAGLPSPSVMVPRLGASHGT